MSATFYASVTPDVKVVESVGEGSYDHTSQTWVQDSADAYAGFNSKKSTTSWHQTGSNGGDCSPVVVDDTKTVFWD